MFGIGGTELLVILVVALLVLGPKSLPQIARTLGKAMGEFRRVSTEFQRTLNLEAANEEHEERKREAEQELFGKKQPSGKHAESTTTPQPQAASSTTVDAVAGSDAPAATESAAASGSVVEAQPVVIQTDERAGTAADAPRKEQA